jgi:hypothetical protein
MLIDALIIPAVSVRQDLRAATKKLGFTLFFRVFYEDFKGDPKKAERGFLKSRYLVKVCTRLAA